MNSIKWTPKAKRQVGKIKNAAERLAVIDGVETLKDFPNVAGIKHLANASVAYRLRVGNWRVLFDFEGFSSIVCIEEVKKRNERTY